MTVRTDEAERIKCLFGLDEIPESIERGWDRIEARTKMFSEAGRPIPRGGCLLLGQSSVVGGALAEMHMELCSVLKVGADSIDLRLDNVAGDIKPVVDIRVPDGWVLPVANQIKDPDLAIRHYLDDVVEVCRARFLRKAISRLDRCNLRRVIPDA